MFSSHRVSGAFGGSKGVSVAAGSDEIINRSFPDQCIPQINNKKDIYATTGAITLSSG